MGYYKEVAIKNKSRSIRVKEKAHFQYEGFTEVSEKLMRMSTSDKETAAIIRKNIDEVLAEARGKVAESARAALHSDPRQAFRAVRRSVYRRVFGGQINILGKRKGQATPVAYIKPRTLVEGQRGGNRIKPSQRTISLDNYSGSDRGFILRFINSGTDTRTSKYGNRGSIAARHWFTPSGNQSMQQAAQQLAAIIDTEIANAFKNA